MTNYEFYKGELIKILSRNIAVKEGKPHYCPSIPCCECEFHMNKCIDKATTWLDSEHEMEGE